MKNSQRKYAYLFEKNILLLYNAVMHRVLIKIEYDGREFYGWQKQPDKRTVQGEIENAIEKLTGVQTELFGSGRTDRGVHALDQAAHFDMEQNIPVKNLVQALNNLLPNDISITKAKIVKDNFHARYDIKKKTYLYQVYSSKTKSAILSNQSAYVSYELDVARMVEASKLLLGKHDFRGFCCADTHVKDFVREIYDIKISKKGKFIQFKVTGSGFLYNMVRIIVGTLVEIGRGKLTNEDIKKALETGNRSFSGMTMPPEGLFLARTYF